MADAGAGKRARHGGATNIADDALRESFARLPGLKDLLRCAATCRRWRRLVTERAFLRRLGHWPDSARRPSFLAGIFFQSSYPGGKGWRPSKKGEYCYRPPRFLSLQAGGVTPLTLDSVVTYDDDDALFDHARPLASRRGVLLVHVLLHSDQHKLHLAVCRPLVGKRSIRLLPPPPFTDHWDGCVILADDDCNLDHKQQQPMAVFQVLFIYRACSYSSNTSCWNAPVMCFEAFAFTMCGPRAGIVTRGCTVHWLFLYKTNPMYCTLNINVATSHVSLTKIPVRLDARRPPIPCITDEGRISFVTIRDHGVAELWTKQDQYEDGEPGTWRCSKLADLGSERREFVFFAESRGALLVGQQGVDFSIVDLKTKEKTPMHLKKEGTGYRATLGFSGWCTSTYCSGHPGITCGDSPLVLYEMDWVFSHHLSSLASLG